jgi:PAS domain S-box-containing protein
LRPFLRVARERMKRNTFTLNLRIFQALTTVNPWHFLWISILLSEVLTALMGLLLKGSVTYDYLLTGGVVSLIVAGIVISLLKLMMQVRLDNKVLREEVEFQSLLMEAIPDLLYVLDPGGMLIKWNRKAEETSGYSRDEIKGKHALLFIAEEDRDEAQAGLEEAYSKGTSTRELSLLTRDGRKILHLFSGAAIRDGQGRFAGFIGIARDISKLRKMEEEVGRAQKLESVGIFASGIAYDFTNLLSSIVDNIHLAVINADHREILRDALQKGQSASLRAKDLTKQLLALSRAASPVKKVAALGSIIREHSDFVKSGSNSVCHVNVASDLWDVEADEGQIASVIGHVVLNAVEAMPEGGTITINAENTVVSPAELPSLSGGKYVKISVIDCGSGIPQAYIQNICDPYFTTKPGHSGMGLAISYAVVRNHEGQLLVESDAGKGTVVHIYLPAANRPHES